jgi:hypothetical protein
MKGTVSKKTTRRKCLSGGGFEPVKNKSRCELCCNDFCELRLGVSRNSVIELRKKWSIERFADMESSDLWDTRLVPELHHAVLYDQVFAYVLMFIAASIIIKSAPSPSLVALLLVQVKLCAFCFQFFSH